MPFHMYTSPRLFLSSLLLVTIILMASVASGSVDPLTFQFRFVTFDKKVAFVDNPPIELMASDGSDTSALPTLTFVCNASEVATRFRDEYWIRSHSLSYMLEKYAIDEVVVVPPTAPAAATTVAVGPAATALPTLTAGQIGPFTVVFAFETNFHYYTVNGDLTAWTSVGPDAEDFESRVATSLFANGEAFHIRAYRTAIVPLSRGIITTLRFWSDASLAQPPARSLQQVYDTLSSATSLQAVMAQFPGCTNITLVTDSTSDPHAYPSFEQIADEGQATYSDQKVNFLVSLIVILIVSVVLLIGGHLFSAKKMEEKEMTQEYGGSH